MNIDRIVIDGWRGFTFDIDFNHGMNVLIGMNGCGKTTILDLIAGLTGTDRATELLDGTFRFIRLDVSWDAGEKVTETSRKRSVSVVTRHETIMLHGSFDSFESVYEIARFKKLLPLRTSYVLRHDLGDNRYLGEIADRAKNIKHTLNMLHLWDLGLKRQLHVRPGYAHYMLSESGAQRQLLTIGMRLPEPGTPMLVDMPERSLHVILRRRIHDFYTRGQGRWNDETGYEGEQVIYATHCPELVAAVASRLDLVNWHNQSPVQRPKHRVLLDLHAKDNTTLRDGYNEPL